MSVRVEEEEMYLTLRFQGAILGGGAGGFTMGFSVDGAASPTLQVASHLFVGTERLNLNVMHTIKLSKGEHVVALTANDVATAGHTIDGAVVHSVFSATRSSDDAVLAHGVDSKVQNIF
jgi:hypothetical protein